MLASIVIDGLLGFGLATAGLMPGGGAPPAGTIHFYIDPEAATLVDFDSGQNPFGPIDPTNAYEATIGLDPEATTVVK